MRVRQLARTVCRGRVHSKRLRPLKPSCTILRQYPEACSLVNDLPWLEPRAKWARPRGWAPSGVQAGACQKPRAASSTGQAEPIGPTRARSHQVEACEGEEGCFRSGLPEAPTMTGSGRSYSAPKRPNCRGNKACRQVGGPTGGRPGNGRRRAWVASVPARGWLQCQSVPSRL